jgi:hypothetical protein
MSGNQFIYTTTNLINYRIERTVQKKLEGTHLHEFWQGSKKRPEVWEDFWQMMEWFCFAMYITGLCGPNTGKNDGNELHPAMRFCASIFCLCIQFWLLQNLQYLVQRWELDFNF